MHEVHEHPRLEPEQAVLPDIPRERWWHCYDERWTEGVDLVAEAFKHPAKGAKGLGRRIIKEGLTRGWWHPGSTLLDPFGGIGGFAHACANHDLRWIGVELEVTFVDLAKRNFELWAREWCACAEGSGWCDACHKRRVLRPVILQGDSRQFSKHVAVYIGSGSVTSPPFTGSTLTGALASLLEGSLKRGDRAHSESGYGHTDGQLADLPLGSITSPPYANRVDDVGTGPVAKRIGAYGETDGNIGNMRLGAVTSPPYGDGLQPFHGDRKSPEALQAWWEHYRAQGGGMIFERFCEHVTENGMSDYGKTDGQIGNLAGAMTSPPYINSIKAEGDGIDWDQTKTESRSQSHQKRGQSAAGSYGDAAGQIARLPEGNILSAITSPPFADVTPHQDQSFVFKRAHGVESGISHTLYGESEGQIGSLSSITSPPFSPDGNQTATKQGTRKDLAQKGMMPEDRYGDTAGQIGHHEIEPLAISDQSNKERETYWEAVAQVYQELLKAMTPGGHAAFVLKGFIRKGKYIDLPLMTLQLLTQIGYEPVLWVDAMLTAQEKQPSMLDEVPSYQKKKASFFRKLYEAKHPENTIDAEIVLVCKKPL